MQASENGPTKAIQAGSNLAFQKESIINLQNYQEKDVRLKFIGGREIQGILKGYDTSLNIVLDSCVEFFRGFKFISNMTARTIKII